MPPIKRYSVDAEHFIRFHVWTENFCCVFKFIRHSVDEALLRGRGNVCMQNVGHITLSSCNIEDKLYI